MPLSIKQCQRAGITVCMMTGDDVGTARTIAEKCGIISRGDKFLVLEGRDLNKRACNSDGQVLNAVLIVCALIHVFELYVTNW